MWSLATLSALAAAGALVVAIDAIGGRLGGVDPVARWIRGWTALWWSVALIATIAGPVAAVVAGSVVVAAALTDGLWRLRERRRTVIAGTVALAAGAPLWLLPPTFYDTLVYHLGLPWSWLVNGSFAPIPHHVFSHFPLAASAVYLLPVGWGVPAAAAALHWMSFAVALTGSHRLATRLGAGRWSWVAPAALLGCWDLVWVASHAAADMVVLVALIGALEALAAEPAPRWFDLALAGGLAAATKYPAMVTVAALLAAGALTSWRAWRTWLAAAAGIAAAASFVPLRNLILTGNPVFPLLWPLLGGSGWNARDNARYTELVREGVGGASSLVTGIQRLLSPHHGLGWAALVTVALAAVALGRSSRRAPARRVGLAGLLMLAGWLVTAQTVRYAFPLAAVLAVLAAVGLAQLGPALRHVAVVGLVAAIAAGLVRYGEVELGDQQIQRAWLGDPEAWRAAVTVNDPLPAYRAAEMLPAGARLLVVGEGRSWGCPVPHHVSSPYDLQLMQQLVEAAPSAERLAADLAAAGWSHLLVNRGELARLGGPEFQVLRWRTQGDADRWLGLLRRWTTPLWHDEVCTLLRLEPAAQPPHP